MSSNASHEGFCGDPFWDLNLTWYTDDPDLTQCFQQTILSWVPCVFLWLMIPLELDCSTTCRRGQRKLKWAARAKFDLSFLLAVFSFVELFSAVHIWRSKGEHATPDVAFITPVIKGATYVLAAVFVQWNRKRESSSSTPLFLFWLMLTISSVVTFRSQIRKGLPDGIGERMTFVMQILQFPLCTIQLLLASFSDRYAQPDGDQEKICPEGRVSFFSRVTFWWISSLVTLGWKRPLTSDDLWTLQADDKSDVHVANFHENWAYQNPNRSRNLGASGGSGHYTSLASGSKSHSLLKTLAMQFWPSVLLASCFRLVNDVFMFLAPFLLKLLVGFVSNPNEESWKGYLYAALMAVSSMVQVTALAHFLFVSQRTGVRIRSSLMGAIYSKSLRLSTSAKSQSTVGQSINLMAVDSQKLMDSMLFVQYAWSCPLQLIIGAYLLWQEMGLATLAGLVTMIVLVPVNGYIASVTFKLQMNWMKVKDKRIKLINEILNGIKLLKLYAWESAFEKRVLGIRDQELQTLKKGVYLHSVSTFMMQLSPFIVALMTFVTFVYMDEKNILDAQKAFVSLALFNILRVPLTLLPDIFAVMVETKVALQRLTQFLCNEELDEDSVGQLPLNDRRSVTVSAGTFSWGKDEPAVLSDINLEIKEGSLVAVVGQVGAGKSSLCAAMLGLMEKLSGDVASKGQVAYVTQQAWIQNMTVKENILFGQPFDHQRYEQVIEACALVPDLEILPAGDETEIGEKGINLSGGQKQRVSLARAAYGDAEVFFLDDPLSAVDAHVGRQIFHHLIGPNGLLKNKTRIFVTHGAGFLSQADQIVLMDNGRILENGSYQQLIHAHGKFATFMKTFSNDVSETTDSIPPIQKIFNAQEPTKIPEKGKLVGAELSEMGGVKMDVYLLFLRNMNWFIVGGIFLFYILANTSSVGTDVWLGRWADDSLHPDRQNSTSWRDYRMGIYGALGSLQGVFILLSALALASGQLRASRQQHAGMFKRIMRAPMSFFDTTPLGRIINRFSKDIDNIDIMIPHHFRTWLNCAFQVLAIVVVICMITPIFAVVILPLALIYFFLQRFFIPTSRQLKRLEAVSRSPIYSHFQESVQGSNVIMAQKQTDRFVAQNQGLMDLNLSCYFPNMIAQRWLAIRVEFIGICVVFFAGLFAVIGRDYHWGISPNSIGLSITYALNITQALNQLIRVTNELQTNIVSVERIKEYSEIEQEASWENDRTRPSQNWPSEGRILFNNYSLRYRPGLDLILDGISCDIRSNEKVGIVGRTGAGKSSLSLALFRIIESASGTIFIDGLNIAELGLHYLRSKLTIIPQDPILFSGTLRMNLDPFDAFADKDIFQALESVHLGHYVHSLPEGLEHAVTEGGGNMSVGQRQLVCLARALLRNARILILDEATAAVDLETDSLIQKTIRDKFADCTVLTIAHRLKTVMDSDRIMVLDAGRVVEFETPGALLKNKESRFYSLTQSANAQLS